MAKGKEIGRAKLPPKTPSQRITVRAASALTKRYQKSAPASEKAGFFHGDGVLELMNQPGVVGLRIYHGLDQDGRYRMVLVGVDADGKDVVTRKAARQAKSLVASTSSDAVVLDGHWPCPPWCPPGSPL